jgi:hypothetical protein
MSPSALAALRALYDVGAVSAEWDHPGYRELRDRRLASFTFQRGESRAVHRLTPRGDQLARELFK